jgi:hypothetical protein
MCFSATASFGVSVLLAAIGTVTVTKAKTTSHKFFAVIPLIFCVQQFIEGLLWLSLTKEYYAVLKQTTTYLFLLFALVVWPVWTSLSIMLLEKNNDRKRILQILLSFAFILSALDAYFLLFYQTNARLDGHHILYSIDSPHYFRISTNVLYFFTAVFPPFLSSVKKLWWIGVALIASYLIAKIFYGDYVISVWCYFATIISVIVLLIIWESKKEEAAA